MLDIKLIRENPDLVKKGIEKKKTSPQLVDDFLALDTRWRILTNDVDELRNKQKSISSERNIDAGRQNKMMIKELESERAEVAEKRDSILEKLPNLPFDDVPIGRDESANKVLRQVGKKPDFPFAPRDYLTLAKNHDLINIEKAGEVAGTRFGYIKNEAVLLEFALIQLAMQKLIANSFTPILPPVMVRPEVMKSMGKSQFISDKDAFYLPDDNLFLVGSSEHTIGPYHMNDTFKEEDLPKRYVGFSTCFRREAGSYGKDTKGILRVHQFDKVEMLSFVKPEESEKEHEFLLGLQEELMQELELPYQVVAISTGDSDPTAARQFDIETWIPSENRYRETQSVSNTTDFQARGINAKYKKASGKSEFVHMLNGTAFSQRPIIAIIENYQTRDHKIGIPKILQKYVGKKEIG